MRHREMLRLVLVLIFCPMLLQCGGNSDRRIGEEKPETTGFGAFDFSLQVVLPGSPETVFDTVTGDISPWWDHTFSPKPHRLFIEPEPGGGFWEIFDEAGNGVLHARVIVADRGKILRFSGPLGLSGQAIQLVCTYTLEPVGKGETRLRLDVHGAGELNPPNIGEIVEGVWRHFLFDRLKSYMEGNLDS